MDARLVVIDTLAKVRKPAAGANVYAEDYAALELLLPLAAKHGVAIVVVHHLRKTAAADKLLYQPNSWSGWIPDTLAYSRQQRSYALR